MQKAINTLIISLSILTTQLSAIIIETPDLSRFEKALEQTNEDCLILFDVDETLLVPKDLVLQIHSKKIWEKYSKLILENPEIVPTHKYNKDYYFSLVLSQREHELVDTKVVHLIQNLQKRNITTIAFTKMFTGSFGVIPSMEDWRLEHLRKHHIDFSKAFSDTPLIQLEAAEPNGRSALYNNGVLYSNIQEKGPVLIAFLDYVKLKPKQVIFIDNRRDYLESVEKSLEGTGIDFLGFYYTAIENRPQVVDEKLAEYQLTHLAKNGVWLSDVQAKERMLNLMMGDEK